MDTDTGDSLRGYIFDLDGTLLDTEVVWVDAMDAYLKAHGYGMPYEFSQKLVYGRSWTDIFRDMTDMLPAVCRDYSSVTAEMDGFFRDAAKSADIVIPGSLELLRRLSQKAECCIVSGSCRNAIAEAVRLMNAQPYVSFWIGAEDCTKGKPDPCGFLAAADRMGVPPSRCVVFEDSEAGITAGNAAGMTVIALALPGHPAQNTSGAKITLHNLSDFDEHCI